MQIPSYNVIDIVFIIILVIGVIQGIRRGLSGEISRLLGTVIAIWFGWHFYRPLGCWLLKNTRLAEKDIYAVSFFICLVGVFILILLLRLLLRRIMELSVKGSALERIGGCLAGCFRMFLFGAAIIFFLNLLPIPYLQNSLGEQSFFGRMVTQHIPMVYRHVEQICPFLPRLAKNNEDGSDESMYDSSKEIPTAEPHTSDNANQQDDL